jgi:4,5-dihydroxyphthalate decarboxylase
MSELKLKTVTRTQGNNRALKDGTVRPRTFAFDFEEVDPLIAAFRRMVRGNEFDICEMAITTYICAKGHGKPMTAVPVFLVRAFHHGAILVNTKAGIRTPKDLEGRKVGVNRGYTVTTGVWARSILQDEHGVDLSKITWVLSGDEHVAEYRAPANVVPIEKGKNIGDMLASGELAAAIGVEVKSPDVKPALRRRGHYPINHLVVIKDELIAKHPDLAADVFDAFARAKRRYVEELKADRIEKPTEVDEVHRRVMEITGEPLPYGIVPNRGVIDELIRHALTQGIISKPVTADDLFAPSTRALAG